MTHEKLSAAVIVLSICFVAMSSQQNSAHERDQLQKLMLAAYEQGFQSRPGCAQEIQAQAQLGGGGTNGLLDPEDIGIMQEDFVEILEKLRAGEALNMEDMSMLENVGDSQ